MRRTLFLPALTLTGIILFTPTIHADFESGRKAANRGDFKAALQEWEPLAQKGDIQALFALGRMYARGDGVTKDFTRARELFIQAADKGHADAALKLGMMYQYGDGVEKNFTTAREWYLKAEAAGAQEAAAKVKALDNEEVAQQPVKAVPTQETESIPCALERPAQDTASWVAGLHPGDSIRTVYCALATNSGINALYGSGPKSEISTPLVPNMNAADDASFKLGRQHELTLKKSDSVPSSPILVNITSSPISVEGIRIAQIHFSARLWFEGEVTDALSALAEQKEILKIRAKGGGDTLFPSTLTAVDLFAGVDDVEDARQTVLKSLKQTFPTFIVEQQPVFKPEDINRFETLAKNDAKANLSAEDRAKLALYDSFKQSPSQFGFTTLRGTDTIINIRYEPKRMSIKFRRVAPGGSQSPTAEVTPSALTAEPSK